MEFAPCVGLESSPLIFFSNPVVFAPCVGLERKELTEKLKSIKFAPCVGLESSIDELLKLL